MVIFGIQIGVVIRAADIYTELSQKLPKGGLPRQISRVNIYNAET